MIIILFGQEELRELDTKLSSLYLNYSPNKIYVQFFYQYI